MAACLRPDPLPIDADSDQEGPIADAETQEILEAIDIQKSNPVQETVQEMFGDVITHSPPDEAITSQIDSTELA